MTGLFCISLNPVNKGHQLERYCSFYVPLAVNRRLNKPIISRFYHDCVRKNDRCSRVELFTYARKFLFCSKAVLNSFFVVFFCSHGKLYLFKGGLYPQVTTNSGTNYTMFIGGLY